MTPVIQHVKSPEDLDTLVFVDDVALVMVPVEMLDQLPLKGDFRSDGPRLRAVTNSIRRHGYNNFEPVIVRLGRRGRWVVVDGGHRLTAARIVSKEFFTNLFVKKVRNIYFILFRTPISNTRIDDPPDTADKD